MGPKRGVSKYYGVKRGRKTGVFTTWDEVKELVNGYPGALHKSFATSQEAQAYVFGQEVAERQQDTNNMWAEHITLPSSTLAIPPATLQPSAAPTCAASTGVLIVQRAGINTTAIIAALRQTAESSVADSSVHPSRQYQMNFDGASRGNPGKAGCGVIIWDVVSGEEVAKLCHPLPWGCTSNIAEYSGIILGLHAALALGIQRLSVKGDSKLVCCQVNGQWKINAEHLVPFYAEAVRLKREFVMCSVEHVLREFNSEADALSNKAIDGV